MTTRYVMPMVIINTGIEMIYVMRQRLMNQQLNDQTVAEYLSKVAARILDKQLLGPAMEQPLVFSLQSLHALLIKCLDGLEAPGLGHSKLMDICSVAVKFQLYNMVHPQELIAWTFNHLDTVSKYIISSSSHPATSAVFQYSDCTIYARGLVQSVYLSMTMVELYMLKQHLLLYFSTVNSKVSQLIDAGLQLIDGYLVVNQPLIPPQTEPVGSIVYFDGRPKVAFPVLDEIQRRTTANNGYISSLPERRSSILGLDMFDKQSDFYNKHKQAPVEVPPGVEAKKLEKAMDTFKSNFEKLAPTRMAVDLKTQNLKKESKFEVTRRESAKVTVDIKREVEMDDLLQLMDETSN